MWFTVSVSHNYIIYYKHGKQIVFPVGRRAPLASTFENENVGTHQITKVDAIKLTTQTPMRNLIQSFKVNAVLTQFIWFDRLSIHHRPSLVFTFTSLQCHGKEGWYARSSLLLPP